MNFVHQGFWTLLSDRQTPIHAYSQTDRVLRNYKLCHFAGGQKYGTM